MGHSFIKSEQRQAQYDSTDVRKSKRIALDSEKLFKKKLDQMTTAVLAGEMSHDEQLKKQTELLSLKSNVERFSAQVESSVELGKSGLSKNEWKEVHHLSNSGLYTQKEVASIYGVDQGQVSKYKNKPTSY
ncbi:hypothetical protein AB4369_26590, partial [Vibrio sp. 10N.261.49.A5]